jgi:hypothetical protein
LPSDLGAPPYHPSEDSIVRSEARRLRSELGRSSEEPNRHAQLARGTHLDPLASQARLDTFRVHPYRAYLREDLIVI